MRRRTFLAVTCSITSFKVLDLAMVQVEDLKSLLESYMRWHSQILPYFAYSQFVEKVEKVGRSKRVRVS